MRCLILQHSTTGNTRLVARFAAERLIQAGWQVERWDIVERPEPPDLTGAPAADEVTHSPRSIVAVGKMIDQPTMEKATCIRIDPPMYTRCGTCVGLCPVGCLSRAITGWFSPPGVGRYPGPSAEIRSLFWTSGPAT